MSDSRSTASGEMLVEHLDVVARVLLRGEGIELAADRVDFLRDVFGAARVGALEEHVLDEVRDAALRLRFVPRAARQPDADAHRADVRHRLGDETKTRVQNLACDHRVFVSRNCLQGKGLQETIYGTGCYHAPCPVSANPCRLVGHGARRPKSRAGRARYN